MLNRQARGSPRQRGTRHLMPGISILPVRPVRAVCLSTGDCDNGDLGQRTRYKAKLERYPTDLGEETSILDRDRLDRDCQCQLGPAILIRRPAILGDCPARRWRCAASV